PRWPAAGRRAASTRRRAGTRLWTASGGRRDGQEVFPPRVQEGARVRVPEHVRREHELRVHRLSTEPHPGLVGQPVPLAQIAAEAGRDDVDPRGLAAARARHDVIHSEPLAPPVAILAGVAVAAVDVLLVERDPIEEVLADVDGEADDGGERERHGW